MTEKDELQLVQAARSGDAQALERLLEHYQQRIYRFSVKMCRDPEEAKDVLQETLLAMSRGVQEFRGAASLSTWLYTIARSHVIKLRRRSKFAPQREESLDGGYGEEARQLPDPARGPEDDLCSREAGEALDAAIAALPGRYREVVLLRDVEGLSTAEVAQVLGVSMDAVKSRLHRARVAVREKVAPVLGLEEDLGQRCPGPCIHVVRLLSECLEGDLAPERCAALESRLAGCESCRHRCESFRRMLSMCRSLEAPEAPGAVRAAVHREFEALRRARGHARDAGPGTTRLRVGPPAPARSRRGQPAPELAVPEAELDPAAPLLVSAEAALAGEPWV